MFFTSLKDRLLITETDIHNNQILLKSLLLIYCLTEQDPETDP